MQNENHDKNESSTCQAQWNTVKECTRCALKFTSIAAPIAYGILEEDSPEDQKFLKILSGSFAVLATTGDTVWNVRKLCKYYETAKKSASLFEKFWKNEKEESSIKEAFLQEAKGRCEKFLKERAMNMAKKKTCQWISGTRHVCGAVVTLGVLGLGGYSFFDDNDAQNAATELGVIAGVVKGVEWFVESCFQNHNAQREFGEFLEKKERNCIEICNL